ncbi:MAG: hypothetical protein J0H01_00550 [Rhizobiales bacterium]|nr:hypothetical protein [Hyphomicrobiales bacterium]
MIIERATGGIVNVAGRPDLSHQRSSILISRSRLWIAREPEDPDFHGTTWDGARFQILLPEALIWDAIWSSETMMFTFQGDGMGTMDELSGYPTLDYGTMSRKVDELAWIISLSPAGIRLSQDGRLGDPIQETWREGIPADHRLTREFRIAFTIPFPRMAEVFRHLQTDHAALAQIHKHLEKRFGITMAAPD